MSIKLGVLKYSGIFKVAELSCTFIIKETPGHVFFPVNSDKFLKTLFYRTPQAEKLLFFLYNNEL